MRDNKCTYKGGDINHSYTRKFLKIFLIWLALFPILLGPKGEKMGQWTKHMFETDPKCHFFVLFCCLFALFVLQRSLGRIYAFWWLKVTFKILSSSLCHTSCFINEYVQLQNKVPSLEKDTETHTTQTQTSLGGLAPAPYPAKVFTTYFNHPSQSLGKGARFVRS